MSERLVSPWVSVENYLTLEEKTQIRHEYVDGQVFAMTGSTHAHNKICGNLFGPIHAHLRGSGCAVCMNDMKLRVDATNSFYYPDLMVSCTQIEADDVCIASPMLIIEVLSPSTKQIDRREKMVAYRMLESLRHYILVHQNKMLVEVYSKEERQWQASILGCSDVLDLSSLPGGSLEISVARIYEGLDVPAQVQEPAEEYNF